MARLKWDQSGERRYETGVDRGILYLRDETGAYDTGFAWNGLVNVTEKPSGAEPTPLYADNIKYLNLISAEEFAASVEAYTYPDEFAQCDGTAELAPGVFIGQQARTTFGLHYRTKIGTDLSPDAGYKLHLIWGALAAPTEKAYATVNDSPEAITFSWELSTSPVEVEGFKPTASMTIDSTKVPSAALKELEDVLYGTGAIEPRLPTIDEVVALLNGGESGTQGRLATASVEEDNSTDHETQDSADEQGGENSLYA